MRRIAVFCIVIFPFAALAQGYGAPRPGAGPQGFVPPAPTGPAAPPPAPYPVQPYDGSGAGQWGGQASQYGYGGCAGCSYMGDYYQSRGPRRPAPPLRIQGQWRNGLWYY